MTRTRERVWALCSGLVFGAGLILSGMTRPERIVGFLDFFGDWDPRLAFVMAGAVATYAPLSRLILKRATPVCTGKFSLPTKKQVDAPLLIGSALFGVGWGLVGFCPGPALTSLGAGTAEAYLFVLSMIVGFAIKRGWDVVREKHQSRARAQRTA